MPFELGAAPAPSGGFGVDVPPEDGRDADAFGLTLQFEKDGVALGPPDVDTLDFRDGITATRTGNRITLNVPASADSELIDVAADGVTDDWAAISGAVSPIGSFVLGGKSRAKLKPGKILVGSLLDTHPSISFPNDARGVTVLVPGDNLPGLTGPYPGQASFGAGAEAAFVRVVPDAPDSDGSLAYSPVFRGMNLDARFTTQVNQVHGVRKPNPNYSLNPIDGDPGFTGNKDYVAGEWYNFEIIGWSGSGIVIEAGNGRFHGHSIRCLNCGLYGMDLGGNDVVLTGHWAAGGCGKFAVKVGNAAGFYATTGNVWSDPTTRSPSAGAMWFNQRKYFCLGYTELNDWSRLDGGAADATGGQISHCMIHQHGVNFDSDGVGHNADNDGDTRLNSDFGITEYKNLSFWGDTFVRTDNVGIQGTYTVDPSTDTFTTSKRNLANGTMVQVVPNAPTGVLAAPLKINTWYYVRDYNAGVFKLAATLGGSAINITDAGIAPQTYTTFPTLGNFGGVGLGGSLGTAPQTLIDLGTGGQDHDCATGIGNAYVSFFCPLDSAPDVKSWTDPIRTVEAITNDGSGNLLVTLTDHGVQTNHRLGFYSMGTPPTGLAMNRTIYYADIDNVSDPTDTFLLCAAPVENGSPTHIAYTDAGTGTLLLTNLSTRPFVANHGNQLVYGYSDSYAALWRFGAIGAKLSQFAFGICEDDDFNPVYRGEIGDRTNSARYAYYGYHEFDKGITYRDNAIINTTTTDGGSRTVKFPEPLHRFSTTGGGISAYTINFETDQKSNWDCLLSLSGGPITTLNFGVIGSGTIDEGTGTIKRPKSSPGSLKVWVSYRRSTNAIRFHAVSAGVAGMPMGRTDGSSVGAGIIGETQRDLKAVGSAVALTTTVPADVHSLTLTPGRYLILGTFGYSAATATGLTGTQWAISDTSATIPGTKDEAYGVQQYQSDSVDSIFQTGTAMKLVNISTTTTYYAVQRADFSGGAISGYGALIALRIA